MDLINAGLMFDRGVDIDGKRLLIFKTKMYTRGQVLFHISLVSNFY